MQKPKQITDKTKSITLNMDSSGIECFELFVCVSSVFQMQCHIKLKLKRTFVVVVFDTSQCQFTLNKRIEFGINRIILSQTTVNWKNIENGI